ncbi:flavodoxin family protein [Clostridium taeniosporum]|uniref:flavodoxin family protein n=1 Tax=Clostridium taeniosporum TaxID=394958 RepID=UPI0026A1F1DA
MVGIYFSGTGNTKHCISKFVKKYSAANSIISIEEPSVVNEIKKNDFIVFAYPIYYSNLPKIINDFIKENKKNLRIKKFL